VTAESAESKLRARLGTKAMRDLYDRWHDLHRGGSLRPLRSFDPGHLEGHDWIFTVEVDHTVEPVTFRMRYVGEALTELLDRAPSREPIGVTGEEALGSLEAAYRRCAKTRSPSYEHARFALGDDPPVTFERLLLPFSEDGQAVTHLLGMARFAGLSPRDQQDDPP
jgi:hypothetical protein